MINRGLVHCFAAIALAGLCGLAQADLWQFNVSLDGLQEVPPNASPGSGTAIAMFDDVSGAMSINGSFSNFVGLSSNAHLHGFAPAGAPAGVLFGLSFTPGVTTGVFSGNGVISGAGNIANTLNGLTYINIHSQTFPGGEIRGQLVNPVQIPEPGSMAVLGGLALASLVSRRRRQ